MKKKETVATEDIQSIETKLGTLQFYRDWEYEGCIVMINPVTIDRYHEIQRESQNIKLADFEVFVAFNDDQFKEGLNSIRPLGNGEKVYRFPIGGLFGTKDGIAKLTKFYSSQSQKTKLECDPQEIYFEEYNNHECMIAFDGDYEAIKAVIDIFGSEVAKGVKRFSIQNTVDEILLMD